MTKKVLPCINFIAGSKLNPKIFELLSWCVFANFEYKQSSEYFKNEGYYIPKDQYEAYRKVLLIQEALDIGSRQDETYP